jgi:hypothetical protein
MRLAILATCLIACALPAVASAATESATSGPVTATLSYHAGASNTYSHLSLRIQRTGAPTFNQAVSSQACGSACWPGGKAYFPPRKSVAVSDLDGDGSPEVVLELYTGGAHCCTVAQIFSFDPATSGYTKFEQNFGDPGYKLVDLNGDGRPEFRSADDRFAYAVASYAGSRLPIEIWRFQGGKLVDVTREFPALIRADARTNLHLFHKFAGRRNDDRAAGALAAWAADEYLVGKGKTVRAEFSSALRHHQLRNVGGLPSGRALIRAIDKLLSTAGYR